MVLQLISKYFQGKATEDEIKVIFDWVDSDFQNKETFLKLKKSWALASTSSEDYKSAFAAIQKRIKDKNRKIRILQYSKYAAVFIGAILCLLYFEVLGPSLSNEIIDENAITLQLENGDIKIITKSEDGKIYGSNGILLGNKEGGKLKYHNNQDNENIKDLVYNELKVPYGKTFQLVLSDESVVYLNSGSSIKYPVKFNNSGSRKVFLDGEAFFEVSKDSANPFIVSTDKMEVKVLGTKFNVSAYPEDENLNTVLVEGSVQLYGNESDAQMNKSTFLKPGQKGLWNKEQKNITIEEVDTSIYTAWMQGKIVFREIPFSEIRKKLERHYDIKIENKNKILDDKTYNATFDVEDIYQVLNTLNENYAIQYREENGKIIIE